LLKKRARSLNVTGQREVRMLPDIATLASLLWGTARLRPYVLAFLLAFLVAAARDVGGRRTLGFLLWASGVAFVAEWASTRVGVPFGFYHYTGRTGGTELYLSNIPIFDSLSFAFLAYAAYCLSRRALGTARGVGVVAMAGFQMMLLDVVIDPLAVRGDRWFLGDVFHYPGGGAYFGVPLSNFAGWLLVGWMIVGGYVAATRPRAQESGGRGGAPGAGVALYYGVLLFNLVVTLWIGEWRLLAAGILVQAGGVLLLYGVGAMLARDRLRTGACGRPISGERGRNFDSTRSCQP
jgi:uncharacterized membrane protein